MFDSFYDFSKVCKTQALNKKYLYETITFRFQTPVSRYTVELEHYHHDIFIIKFYRTKDRKSKLRFNIMTNEHNCPRIVATCIQILLFILKQKPNASFGFIGANTVDPVNKVTESKQATKRFRVYKKAMENLIGDDVFYHTMDEVHSTYLMINNKNLSVEDLMEKAKTMFEQIYPELENS